MSSGTLARAQNGAIDLAEGIEQRSELVSPPTVGVARLEIDTQVATAHQYPRSVASAIRNAQALATLNPDIAASCTYALPGRKGGSGEAIIGPSIRLAEIFASCWGNMRVESRIVDDDGKFVTAEAMCWDLETNLAVKVQKKRRVTGRDGRRFSDDMVNVTCNAAISIALRDAIFRVVPRTYVEHVRAEAAKVVVGDAETLEVRRDKCLAYFSGKGISADRVFATLSIKGIEDLTPDHFVTLRGIEQAIRNGEVTLNDAFPPLSPVAGEVQGANESRAEFLARTIAAKSVATPAAEVPPTATDVAPETAKANETTKKAASAKKAQDEPRDPGQEG